MADILRVSDLHVKDERHAILAGLSFHVEKGEKVAIVGESGCGKTMSIRTILHTIPGDVTVTSGSILFNGEETVSLGQKDLGKRLYDRIGFVAQNTTDSLHPYLKIARQMTDFYLEKHRGMKKAEAEERARGLLKELGLEDVDRILSSRPGQLSGGMKQRINIAIALIDDIDLLIADEPTSALDAHIRRQIENLYVELGKRTDMSMLLVSHDLGFVRCLADRVYVMYAGKMVEEGTVDEIFSSPVHPYTRALIALGDKKSKSRNEDLAELGGYLPPFGRESGACAFASICRYEKSACLENVEYRKLGGSHHVRCLR